MTAAVYRPGGLFHSLVNMLFSVAFRFLNPVRQPEPRPPFSRHDGENVRQVFQARAPTFPDMNQPEASRLS